MKIKFFIFLFCFFVLSAQPIHASSPNTFHGKLTYSPKNDPDKILPIAERGIELICFEGGYESDGSFFNTLGPSVQKFTNTHIDGQFGILVNDPACHPGSSYSLRPGSAPDCFGSRDECNPRIMGTVGDEDNIYFPFYFFNNSYSLELPSVPEFGSLTLMLAGTGSLLTYIKIRKASKN